jgi:hypothetical protein
MGKGRWSVGRFNGVLPRQQKEKLIKRMNKNNYLPWIVAAGVALTIVVALPVFAQTPPAGVRGGPGGRFVMHGGMMPPGVFGTVSAVSGTTLTVTAKMHPYGTSTAATASSTVYTVDASNAQVMKNGTSSTVSAIAAGDMVMVQGTVNGTNVTATVIRDGVMGMMGRRGAPGAGWVGKASSTPPIQGNGEPVVAGTVTAIGSSSLTITNASNVTYTIDVSIAKIVKNGTTTALSAVATGDNIVVQGTVNGNAIAASSVLDQGSGGKINPATPATPSAGGIGFLGAIGNFFKHLFGF